MPNAMPPHRPPPAASPADRLEMVRRAIQGHDGLSASGLEIQRGGVSYTVDTARELARRFPKLRFAWLIGSDEARAMPSWHEADRLRQLIDFVVFNRPGVGIAMDELEALGFPRPRLELVTIHTPPIAAQEIRDAIHRGQAADGRLPPSVRAYIEERGLYR